MRRSAKSSFCSSLARNHSWDHLTDGLQLRRAKWEGKKKKKIKEEQKKFESKKEYFIKNGGILLEKQIALSQGKDIGAGQLKIMSEDEIEKATNYYDPDLLVGNFRGTNFYMGTLDDKVLGIKTSENPDSNPELVDLFLTAAAVGMVLCHNNMIDVYGCCLETCVPMVIYDVHPRKDLYKLLHGEKALLKPLLWTCRVSVATDVAYALSYMHNALSQPVVHRDVMSFGILLDSSFHAKLAFSDYSVAITRGQRDQRWPVHGALGYIDPEYMETQKVTEKCDVYSFGVLMLELLTSRDPVEMARCGYNLVDEFVSEVKKNGFKAAIDMILLEEDNTDDIQRFAQLALKCVAKKGEERPSMISVVEELWVIQDQVNNKTKLEVKPCT
ncbi:wall-associated receptor kinase-like 2 isoform X1 [Silene latifolia]|uniref:wall-associated receptor kinase-like 2 isoform X1 n=1 Tax=Silene latifolia TaxID=37657 RepID=UPI003D781DEB